MQTRTEKPANWLTTPGNRPATKTTSPRIALARTRTLQRGALRAAPVIAAWRAPAWTPGKALGTFVPKLTQKSFQKFGFATAVLLTDWATIIGQDLARDTMPERLKWPRGEPNEAGDEIARGGATLVLRVDPARALDISYKERQIVERINTYFGYRAVSELRIIQAPIACAPQAPPDSKRYATVEPTRPSSSAIASDPLSQALARLESGVLAGKSRVQTPRP